MRKCKDCLHWTGWIEPPETAVPVQADFCRVHREHLNGVAVMLGCDDFWPKDGAKCKDCRFATKYDGVKAVKNSQLVTCHLNNGVPTYPFGKHFCEKWRAKE